MTPNDHTQPPLEPGQPVLSPADGRAIDALFEAGLDPAKAAGGDAARVRKAASLLNLLAARAPRDAALVDVTLARIMQADRAQTHDASISSEDEAALDAWVMNGYQAERVPHSLRDRARRLDRLAAQVTSITPRALAANSADSLVDRTLARVQQSIDSEERSLRIETERLRIGSGIRLADLISVAAVLLIAAAVVWPVVNNVRDRSRQYACLGNMGSAARAFGLYAGANRESLPVANASLGGGTWWNVGDRKGKSNSANLFQLTRSGYARLADLACPGNPSAPTGDPQPDATDWRSLDEVSYSYRIMYGQPLVRWAPTADNRIVVMSDRSPVVVKSIRGEPVSPLADSMNHRAKGQHVLFSDGHADWLDSPELPNGDNIWLPRFIEQKINELTGKPILRGEETPAGLDDAFVGP